MTIDEIRDLPSISKVEIVSTKEVGAVLFAFRESRRGFMCVVDVHGVKSPLYPAQIALKKG